VIGYSIGANKETSKWLLKIEGLTTVAAVKYFPTPSLIAMEKFYPGGDDHNTASHNSCQWPILRKGWFVKGVAREASIPAHYVVHTSPSIKRLLAKGPLS
jgi:hypothetical protein